MNFSSRAYVFYGKCVCIFFAVCRKLLFYLSLHMP